MVFQHLRLASPHAYRLLNLSPSPDHHMLLNISIFEHSLNDDVQEFEALSYVWGSPIGTLPCEVDGQELLITPNCDSALRHLRLQDKARTLWVDAICIDQGSSQASIEERNSQITLMGHIYRDARKTLCWLGEAREFTAGTFERLKRIGECPSKRELKKLKDSDEQLRRQGKLESNSTCLNHVFCHPWHSRIWTLQEVAFSWDCVILCGHSSISWSLYIIAAKYLVLEEFIVELNAQAWKSYVSIAVRETLRASLFGERPLSEIDVTLELLTRSLTQVRHLQATNPKDTIYGLYAIFDKLGVHLPAPNYEKSLETIYEEACLAVIVHSGSLQVLRYAPSNARSECLPSWVPDWQDEDITLKNPKGFATDDSRTFSDPRIFAKGPLVPALSPQPGQLLVRGLVVGQITTCSHTAFVSHEFPAESLPILQGASYDQVVEAVDSLRLLVHRIQLFREWVKLIETLPSQELFLEDNDTKLFHRLLSFDDQESMISTTNDIPIFNTWIDVLLYPDTNQHLIDGEQLATKWKETDGGIWDREMEYCAIIAASFTLQAIGKCSDIKQPEIGAQLMDYTAHIAGNMGNRRFIIVHDKSLNTTLPGTVYHTAQVDDFVVLLEGSDTPVVLRQKNEKQEWVFIGPAYVLGLMDGEAWPEADDDVELENFILV